MQRSYFLRFLSNQTQSLKTKEIAVIKKRKMDRSYFLHFLSNQTQSKKRNNWNWKGKKMQGYFFLRFLSSQTEPWKVKTKQTLERETDIVEESRMDWERRSEQFGPHPPPSPSKRRRRHRSIPSLSLSLSEWVSEFVCFCNWLLSIDSVRAWAFLFRWVSSRQFWFGTVWNAA